MSVIIGQFRNSARILAHLVELAEDAAAALDLRAALHRALGVEFVRRHLAETVVALLHGVSASYLPRLIWVK